MSDERIDIDWDAVIFIVFIVAFAGSIVVGLYFNHQENIARIQAGQEVKDGR